jgi:hypothetical protein
MNSRITRRAFGGLMASGGAAAILASTGRLAFADGRLRLIWWGNPDRDKRTLAVIDLYKEVAADITVDPETYAGTTTGRSSRHKPPARTCRMSSRWTTATYSSTRAADNSPT